MKRLCSSVLQKAQPLFYGIFVDLMAHTNVEVVFMSKSSIYFTVDHVNGKHDVKELKRELDTFPGVISVSVNDKTESIAVDFDTTGVQQEQLQKRIEKLGYGIIDTRFENHIM